MNEKSQLPSLFCLCLIIISTLICFDCERSSHAKILNEKLFVQIYCDVIVYADLIEATRREAFVDSVLNNYGISREQLSKTVEFYSKDEKRWERVFSKIIAELEHRNQILKVTIDSSRTK